MALLNKSSIKSLVAVGSLRDGKFICDSTGFQIGFLTKDAVLPEDRLYTIFLVTNRHVFNGRERATFRVNTDDGKSKTFETPLRFPNGENRWLAHKDPAVDLALLSVNAASLKENGIQPAFISEEFFGHSKNFEEIGVAVGDDVYVLGFPMGIAGEDQNYACVKGGLISRLDSEIIQSKKAFIIDSSIFPGNSGGPVILRPTKIALEGTKAIEKCYLLGVVKGYLPYSENLYTHQTEPPTVVSTTRENSGLSFCVPMDFVKEIYSSWQETQKPIDEPQKSASPEDLKEEVRTSAN
jgi:hypothetical protein